METAAEVLRTALEFEDRGRRFYLESIERVADPVVKAVLGALAHDEEAHAGVIARFYDALKRSRGWPDDADDLPAPEPARERIRRIMDDAAAAIGDDETYQTVYERARELEIQSRDFYRDQAQAAQDQHLAKFYQFLHTVEQTHIEVLDALLKATREAGRPPGGPGGKR